MFIDKYKRKEKYYIDKKNYVKLSLYVPRPCDFS